MALGLGLGNTFSKRAGFGPMSLFGAGEQGAVYEIDDPTLTTATSLAMYQDAAGTTPVTAVEQPVGLLLDKMGGYNYGPELAPGGGTFDASTGWALAQPTAGSTTIAGGVLTINSTDGSYAAAVYGSATPIVAGKTYEYEIVVQTVTTGAVAVSLGGLQSGSFSAAGTYRGTITAISANPHEVKRASGPTNVVVASVSVREITGRSGLVRGPELVTNGGFASATGWTLNTNVAVNAGRLEFTGAAASYLTFADTGTWIAGRVYELTFDYSSTAALTPFLAGTALTVAASGAGKYRVIVTCTVGGVASRIQINNNALATGWIDNVSVRELAGNHASQSTAAARPTLSARVNLLLKSDNFADAQWAKEGGAVSSSNLFTPTTANALHRISQGITCTLGAAYAVRCRIKSEGVRYVNINSDAVLGVRLTLDTQTGTFAKSGANQATAGETATLAADGYWDVTYKGVGTGTGSSSFYVQASNASGPGDASYASNGTDGFRIDKVQVELGSTATRYQRVNTATDYDTAGFPHYLKFDGVDDSLVTGSIDFTGTNKMTAWAGAHKASDVLVGTVMELSVDPNTNNGTFGMYAPFNAATGNYAARSKGTTLVDKSTLANFPAPHTAVVSMSADISAPLVLARVNGGNEVTATGTQGTGNYGNYPLYIGKRGNGAGTNFLNGRIYGLILRGAASTAAQIAATERYVATKTGVTL